MIAECRGHCRHEGQDELHGAGRRVLNLMRKGEKSSQQARCTVCGVVQDVKDTEEVKK